MLTASFLKSELSTPGNRRVAVRVKAAKNKIGQSSARGESRGGERKGCLVLLTGETRHDFGDQRIELSHLGRLDLELVLNDLVERFVLLQSTEKNVVSTSCGP